MLPERTHRRIASRTSIIWVHSGASRVSELARPIPQCEHRGNEPERISKRDPTRSATVSRKSLRITSALGPGGPLPRLAKDACGGDHNERRSRTLRGKRSIMSSPHRSVKGLLIASPKNARLRAGNGPQETKHSPVPSPKRARKTEPLGFAIAPRESDHRRSRTPRKSNVLPTDSLACHGESYRRSRAHRANAGASHSRVLTGSPLFGMRNVNDRGPYTD